MRISGRSPDGKFVEIAELPGHPWFVAVQFHPEFQSRPLKPHPLFASFVEAALAAEARRRRRPASASRRARPRVQAVDAGPAGAVSRSARAIRSPSSSARASSRARRTRSTSAAAIATIARALRRAARLQGVVRQGQPHVDRVVPRARASTKACACSPRSRRAPGLPILTDIHEPAQAAPAAEVADVLQIPAFLSRQTDLLVAAAQTGRAVNVKKGQFLAPGHAARRRQAHRARATRNVLVTERGVIVRLQQPRRRHARASRCCASSAIPVVFDVTHSLQLPGAGDGVTAGLAEYIEPLAAGRRRRRRRRRLHGGPRGSAARQERRRQRPARSTWLEPLLRAPACAH